MLNQKHWHKTNVENGYIRYLNGKINKRIPRNFQDYIFITDGAGYLNVNYDIPIKYEEDYDYALNSVYKLAIKNFKQLTTGRTLTIPNSASMGVKDTLNNTRLQHYFKWKKDRLPTEEEFQEFCNAVANFNNDLDKFKIEL